MYIILVNDSLTKEIDLSVDNASVQQDDHRKQPFHGVFLTLHESYLHKTQSSEYRLTTGKHIYLRNITYQNQSNILHALPIVCSDYKFQRLMQLEST